MSTPFLSYPGMQHFFSHSLNSTIKKALLASLFLHFVFVWLGYDLGRWFESHQPPPAVAAQQNQQKMAAQTRPKERYVPFAVSSKNDPKPPPKAQFKSDKNQNVAQETMARLQETMGLGTTNTSIPAKSMPKGSDSTKKKKSGQSHKTPHLKDLFLNNEAAEQMSEITPPQAFEEAGNSISESRAENRRENDALLKSRLNYALPDSKQSPFFLPNSNLAMGNVTLLNTFYSESASFDRRVYEALLPLWNQEVAGLPPALTSNLVVGNYVSALEVIIDHLGQIKTVEVLLPSGIKPLDLAAYRAVMKMQAFPNPPTLFRTGPDTYTLRFQFNLIVAKGTGVRR